MVILYGSRKEAPVDMKSSPVLKKKGLKAWLAKIQGAKQVTFSDKLKNKWAAKYTSATMKINDAVKAKLKNIWSNPK